MREHFGNPIAEQRALEEERAVCPLDRAVAVMTGVDRHAHLHSLLSQRCDDLAPGDSREALGLDPNGRIEFALGLLEAVGEAGDGDGGGDDGGATYLLGDREAVARACDFLIKMRFMRRFELSEAPELAIIAGFDEAISTAGEIARARGALVGTWDDPWPGPQAGGTFYAGFVAGVGPQKNFHHPGEDLRARWLIIQAAQREQILDELAERGISRAGEMAWEATRIARWRPRWSREVDQRAIAHELDWLRSAVHLEKGCYRGQETIARVVNLGLPPRRLTMLQLDGSTGDLPQIGARVFVGKRAVGHITSVGRHGDYGPIALALLKRRTDPTATALVEIADSDSPVSASQEIIVPPEGKSAASPAQRPGEGITVTRRTPRA